MLDVNGANNNEFLEYKGRPLVRQGDDIYYGDMSDKFYIYMMIMNEAETEFGTVPTQIMVQNLVLYPHRLWYSYLIAIQNLLRNRRFFPV